MSSNKATDSSPSKGREPSPLFSMFMAGVAGCITVTFIHPIDVVKTWIQASKSDKKLGVFDAVRAINSASGWKGFYKGLTAAYMRESVYTSTRIGLYEHAKHWVGAGKTATIWQKLAAGAISGALGSIVGNPFDVLKTRMMADKTSSRSVFSHISEVRSNQGLTGFYRGLDANIMRAMVLNSTKVGHL